MKLLATMAMDKDTSVSRKELSSMRAIASALVLLNSFLYKTNPVTVSSSQIRRLTTPLYNAS